MAHRGAVYPKSRRSGVLVDHVRDETIVYDEERQQAHSLNRTAGFVWTHSDGTRSVSDLAALLANELGIEVSESLVEYTLEELSRVHLLENQDASEEVSVGRRDVLRRLATAGAAAVALPVVLSVLAPTPAMAASGSTQNSQGQNNNNQGQQ
jgi:coenzyme PQQ synthesis protein D (PqqD)